MLGIFAFLLCVFMHGILSYLESDVEWSFCDSA